MIMKQQNELLDGIGHLYQTMEDMCIKDPESGSHKRLPGYYDARSDLACVFRQLSDTEDIRMIQRVLARYNIRKPYYVWPLAFHEVAFYFDQESIEYTESAIHGKAWRLHLFYSYVGGPLDKGHGHMVVLVDEAGMILRQEYHRFPALLQYFHRSLGLRRKTLEINGSASFSLA